MNAAPVLNFALNAINIMRDNGSQASHPGFVSGYENFIVGKKYISSTQAYRGAATFTNRVNKSSTFFDDPNDTSSDPDEINDAESFSSSALVLSGGLEYRRGHNRLQGFYGAESILGFGCGKTSYDYGISAEDDLTFNGQTRELLYKSGNEFVHGARGIECVN